MFFLSHTIGTPMKMPWLYGGPFQSFPAGGRRFRILQFKKRVALDADLPAGSGAG